MKRHSNPSPTRVRDQALNVCASLIGSDASVLEDLAAFDGLSDEESDAIMELRAKSRALSQMLFAALHKHRRDNPR